MSRTRSLPVVLVAVAAPWVGLVLFLACLAYGCVGCATPQRVTDCPAGSDPVIVCVDDGAECDLWCE